MAYTYRVEQRYDSRIPQTRLLGFAPRGLAMHWTAGGPGRQGALNTISFFINTAAERNASYHILVYWEAATRVFGVIWIVPPTVAAHSMAPKPVSQGGSYDPNAEVRRILGTKVNDPNAGCIAVSFAGMPADLAAAMKDPDFVAGYRRLIKELVEIPSIVDRPLFNHGWAQPTTRYDAGTQLIPAIYGLAAPAPTTEEDMQYWRPVKEDWWTVAKTPTSLGTIFYDGDGKKKEFTSREKLTSVAESSDGRYRLCKYGTAEFLVVDARGNDKEGPGLISIAGSRVPAPGSFGFPPPEVVTKTVVKEVPVPDPAAVDAAVDAEQARIRSVLGI